MPTEETKDQKICLIVDKNGYYHKITQITNLNPEYIIERNGEHAVPLKEGVIMNNFSYYVITDIQTEILGSKKVFKFNDRAKFISIEVDKNGDHKFLWVYEDKFDDNPLAVFPMEHVLAVYANCDDTKPEECE